MRYVKFKKFGAKHFKNHIDPIDLEIPEKGIILFTGPNGSGKTSFLEIIPFTFFGVTPKGLTSNDVVNNKMNKDCITFVEYEIHEEDGTINNYKCTRYCNYKSIGNSVILEKNDNKEFRVGHREVIKEINKLWAKDVFMNTMFFAQKVKDFFLDIQDSSQKQIFKSILKTHDYESYKEIANEKMKEVNEIINNLNSNINLNRRSIEDCNNHITRLENEEVIFYKEKEERVNKLHDEIIQIKNNLHTLNLEKNNININQLKEELNFVTKNKNDVEFKLSNLEESKKKDLDDLNNQLIYKKSDLEGKFNQNKNELYNTLKNSIDELSEYHEKEINELQVSLNEIINKQQNLQKELNELIESSQNDFDIKLDNLSNEYNTIVNKENNLNIKQNELSTNINNIQNTLDNFFKDISKIMSGDLEECPLCKSEINDHTKQSLQDEVNNYEEEKQKYVKEKEEVEKELQNIKDEKTSKFNEIENFKNDFEKEKKSIKLRYQDDFNNLLNSKHETENEIKNKKEEFNNKKQNLEEENSEELKKLEDKLNDVLRNLEEVNNQKVNEIDEKYKNETVSLEQQLKEKENQINVIEERINNYDNLINQINNNNNLLENKNELLIEKQNEEFNKSQLEYYKNKIDEYNNLINTDKDEYDKHVLKLESLEFWKKGFSNSGIPSMLIDEAIPFMNRVIKHYLDEMTFGRYVVSFDTLKQNKKGEFKDKISVNIFDNHTNANQRNQLSGGQARLIDIVTILTLADLQNYIQNIKSNLLVFDEIFDSLDNENIGMVSKSIRKISEEKPILIISHSYIDQLEVEENLNFYN